MILNTEDGKGRFGTCNGTIYFDLNLSKTFIYFKKSAMTRMSCGDEEDSIEWCARTNLSKWFETKQKLSNF